MKESDEYEFKFKTFKVELKEAKASDIFEKLYSNDEYCFLYESLETSGKIGRYSIIGAKPMIIFKTKKSKSTIITEKNKAIKEGDPFELLKSIIDKFPDYPSVYPFPGGAVGYVSYDSIRYIENIPDKNTEEPEFPDLYFIFPSEIIIIDNFEKTTKIIIYGKDIKKIENKGEILIKSLKNINPVKQKSENKKNIGSLTFKSNFSKDEFENIVRRAKEYIREGDIFQVVFSQRFETTTDEQPFEIYKRLGQNNPSPYMYFINFKDFKIIGSSPEILIKLENGMAISRPIAGTRKRGKTQKEDSELERELLNDEKEIAEHIMLVDLARNDLGRVCEYGSVKVDELMKIERYSKVMHIVSNITGKLSPESDYMELFKTSFPAGTVSGSPKIRAMEIIDSLENIKRGIYAGGIGYFGFNKNIDFCIAIRTIIAKDRRVFIQAGAGIVADSIPKREYKETLNKAEALKLTIRGEI